MTAALGEAVQRGAEVPSIDAGLLDELTLMISPVVAGGGRQRLFMNDTAQRSFELIEAQGTSSGAVIATYRPKPAS